MKISKADLTEELLGHLVDRIEYYAVEAVEDYHAIATGKLRNAIHVRLVGSGDGRQIQCYAEGSNAPYAQYVHEGRDPGKMPPVSPLILWAKKKGIKGGGAMFPQIGSGRVDRTRIRIGKTGRVSPNKRDISAFREAALTQCQCSSIGGGEIQVHQPIEGDAFQHAINRQVQGVLRGSVLVGDRVFPCVCPVEVLSEFTIDFHEHQPFV